MCAGDVDGDGHTDLFMSQNFFGMPPEERRLDAGRGLLLRGDGRGGFTALSGEESGIKVYGEQRGAAFCDFDHDGRLDLAVGQNGAETKLFRNLRGRAGLRVRLSGPPGTLMRWEPPCVLSWDRRWVLCKRCRRARDISLRAASNK